MGTQDSGRSVAADPVVTASGPLPPVWQDQLVSCAVDENVGLPDAATLTFRDPNHEMLTATGITIGSPLTVSVASTSSQAPKPIFTGEVTALELDTDGTGSFTVVRAMSKAHRLMRGRKVRAFRNMTAAAIVRKVASGAGLRPGRIKPKPITYKQLSQANVSDWEFLQNLAQEHGVIARVDEQGKLDFTTLDPASGAPAPSTSAAKSPFVLEYGRNLLALRAALTAADQVDTVEVRGWNVDTKKPLVAKESPTTSDTVRPGMTATEATRKFGQKTQLLVTDTPYGTQAETSAAARSAAASMRAGLGEVEAVAEGNPELRAGVPIALGNVGPSFSGRYTATAVHHILEPGQGYRTTVLVSTSTDRSLTGLVTGGNAPDRGPRMPGLATGIVTDIKEAGKAERGWVKLKFPWLADDYVTDWVRTVQLGGRDGGGVFSPDVNDEVLVGFEQGCLDHPYVLGGLYNGKDNPSPHDLPLVDRTTGRVNRRSLVSRKGHRLELVDSTTDSGLRLTSGTKRLDIRFNEKQRSIDITVRAVGGKRTLSSMSLTDRGITLDAGAGDLKLTGRSISIDAKTSVSVNGRTNVSLDGGAMATLRGRMVRIN